ncbi:2-dehydro-3-deoxygalactonokinase [Parasedimentitalea psychrophila]|uniref:2-dehydro-3-deoxygalactonokinase n=1 Tax=Parasedimentitalea psychrophila TaxID=2997337 RepID=A0A9Y2L0Y4_9RHOB|nr:2-dehydro-3-deoxygalactonokinase [Parasedimentitalea psychrophila]WIY25656.1 2-dehydro-3-deoxygalactonokinase [Parasedimentitalea psychrophila]
MENLNWIAVDWGTSHLRLWLMDDQHQVLQHIASARGMSSLRPEEFEPTLIALVGAALPEQGRIPVICCGMVGSRQGWAEARYSQAPCTPPSIDAATRVQTEDPRISVYLLPGIKQLPAADVMRGEETQIAGFLAVTPDFDGVICLPGTHCKWVHISAGEVVSFRTFMTGELFALICGASVLRHSVGDDGWDAEAFEAAVADAISRPSAVAGNLFSIRAETLLCDLGSAAARSRISGLLIGIELAAARPYWLGQDVVIVGESGIAAAYESGLAQQGAMARRVTAENMTLNGLRAARAKLAEMTP